MNKPASTQGWCGPFSERQTTLGSNHPATLESMQELAILYKEQARYVEAVRITVNIVEIELSMTLL